MKKRLEPLTCRPLPTGNAAFATAVFKFDGETLRPLIQQVLAEVLALEKREPELARPNGEPQTALLLTPQEAAEALAISERTLWDLKEAGEIPVVQVGRAVRYARSDLESWIVRRRSASAPSVAPLESPR